MTQTKNESPEMDLTRKNDHENSILILLSHLMLPAHLERNRFRDYKSQEIISIIREIVIGP